MTGRDLRQVFHLSHKVSLYVPSEDETGKRIDQPAAVERVAGEFSDLFGGATATKARGFWRHSTGRIQAEAVTVVYAFAEVLDDAAIDRLYALATDLKRDLRQDSIALELDGTLYLV